MKLNREQLELADIILQKSYDKKPAYVGGVIEEYSEYSEEEVVVVINCLDRERIIEKFQTLEKDRYRITDLGIDIIDDYGSYSGYINRLEEGVKKEERKIKKESHLLSLNIVGKWFVILTFLVSVPYNIYQHFEKINIKSKIENMLLVNVNSDEYALFEHKESEVYYFVKVEEIGKKHDENRDKSEEEEESIIYNCYPSKIDSTNNTLNVVDDGVRFEIPKKELRGCMVQIDERK